MTLRPILTRLVTPVPCRINSWCVVIAAPMVAFIVVAAAVVVLS
jgi:hypothetical protein